MALDSTIVVDLGSSTIKAGYGARRASALLLLRLWRPLRAPPSNKPPPVQLTRPLIHRLPA